MASLQLTFKDIREEVQRYLGFGRTTAWATMTPAQQGDVLSVVNRGFRQFYSPMPLPNESSGHDWSFLRGEGLISTEAPYSTGNITTVGLAVSIAGGGVFDASTHPDALLIANGEYRKITEVGGATAASIDRAFSSNLSSSAYEILDGTYLLPTDFGGLRGSITFRDNSDEIPLRLVNESAIRRLRSDEPVKRGVPEYAAIVPADTENTSETAQLYKLSLWPYPDKVYDLFYTYTVYVNALSSDNYAIADDNHVPIGGAYHSETILASCLAIAEQIVDEFNNPGKMQAKFTERLAASISYDRRNMLPDGFGYNGDHSDHIIPDAKRRRIQTVTRNNVLYP